MRSAVASAEHDLRIFPHEVQVYEELQDADRWQACCGVLGLKLTQADPCGTCSQRETCTALRLLVERTLVRDHGSADPLLDEQRRKQREDTARCRARAAAARAATLLPTQGPLLSLVSC